MLISACKIKMKVLWRWVLHSYCITFFETLSSHLPKTDSLSPISSSHLSAVGKPFPGRNLLIAFSAWSSFMIYQAHFNLVHSQSCLNFYTQGHEHCAKRMSCSGRKVLRFDNCISRICGNILLGKGYWLIAREEKDVFIVA